MIEDGEEPEINMGAHSEDSRDSKSQPQGFSEGASPFVQLLTGENIEQLVKFVIAMTGIAKLSGYLLKIYLDHLGAKSIRVKDGDFEFELRGNMTDAEISRILQIASEAKGAPIKPDELQFFIEK
ncbi:MAG: hypothetical protein AAFV19_20830 [Pseudomonadota bacterium]